MDLETSLQARVIKFATNAHMRMLIFGIVTGISGLITVCFGIGLYRRPVKNEYGEPVLDDDYDQVYEETVLGNTVLTVGIIIMILSLYFLGGGLLAKCLESAAKRKNIRRLRAICFTWTLLSLIITGLLCVTIVFTGNMQPVYFVIIACGLLIWFWRLSIICQLVTECKDNDYKY